MLYRADEVFCSSSGNLAESVMSVTGGKGAHAVVDSVGGDLGVELTNSVRKGGTVYLYGLMAGLEMKASGPALLFR
jgi:NADPH:quinone reductase-like Zn-dependent oxidoreductase